MTNEATRRSGAVDVLAGLGMRATRVVVPIAPLLTRLVMGEAFLFTGLGKWRNFDNTVSFFTDIGIPAPTVNAAFIASLELVGGVCLLLGFGTRVFAALLSSTMVVALLTADRAAFLAAIVPGAETGLTDVSPLVFLLFLVWLVAHGAGALSVDRLAFGNFARDAKTGR